MRESIFEIAQRNINARARQRADRSSGKGRKRKSPRPPEPPVLYGKRFLSTQEAADLMGNSVAHVRLLAKQGWIDHLHQGGRVWIHPDAAADRARLNQLRREQGGRYTYNCWKHKAPQLTPIEIKGRPAPPPPVDFNELPIRPDEIWITSYRAADYLGIQTVTFLRLARLRGMARRTRRELGLRKGEGQGVRAGTRLYALSHVHAMQDERDRMSHWRSYTPAEWRQYRSWRPPRNSNLEDVPPNDSLITVADAAQILDCSMGTVKTHIKRGRLFVWQEHPGRCGCPTYLSLFQVTRYANIPERVARKQAHAGVKVSSLEQQEFHQNFLSKCRINPETNRRSGASQDRDYGDVFTTHQAAAYLGVTPGAVRALARKRRLQAHRRPMRPGQYANKKWLYFKKEDIYALANDPMYRQGRASYEVARQRREEREYLERNPPEPTQEEIEAFEAYKRRRRVELWDPNLTNHATRNW